MPFLKKLATSLIPISVILVSFFLGTSTVKGEVRPPKGDSYRSGTVENSRILPAKGGSTEKPPAADVPPILRAQEKPTPTPTPNPDKKKDEADKPKPAANSPKQTPPPGGWDYSENFEKDNLHKFYYGVGNCKCDGLLNLKDAVQETLEYFKTNRPCITGAGGPGGQPPYMAINDYRNSTGCMYVIDTDGKCVKAVDAAYGIGSSQGGAPPEPGCGNGSLATPSGFHVTAAHTGGGGRYDTSNSLLMKDVQGQGSAGRGILIHAGSCSGGACSWGCTGVSTSGESSDQTFLKIKGLLPPGSLVYNYFGSKGCPGLQKGSCSSGQGSSGSSRPAGSTNLRSQ